jgi:hypothetical protein
MKKGLVALFAAALAISASVSFGYAPTIRPLPDITIGDMEDNLSTQDRNFFVFTNAFRFDDYAQDQDTTCPACCGALTSGMIRLHRTLGGSR